jgi:hypothetical protein
MKFGWETPKQVIHGSKLVDLPHCINDPNTPMPIVNKFKMN